MVDNKSGCIIGCGVLFIIGLIGSVVQSCEKQQQDKKDAEIRAQVQLIEKKKTEEEIEKLKRIPVAEHIEKIEASVKSGNWELATKHLTYVPYDHPRKAILTERVKIGSAAQLKRIQEEKEKQERDALRLKDIKRQFSAWDGSHEALEKYIKRNMNDPNSYDHVNTVYWDMKTHLVVVTSFRGKNAFGGVVLNHVKAKISLSGEILEILETQ